LPTTDIRLSPARGPLATVHGLDSTADTSQLSPMGASVHGRPLYACSLCPPHTMVWRFGLKSRGYGLRLVFKMYF
jgi:hypothetical protein